jgi:hypothetical protein
MTGIFTEKEGSCVIDALQYLSKLDDVEIVKAAIKQGMHSEEIVNTTKELGITIVPMDIKPTEVRKFLTAYPKGTFLVRTCDHIFVIENKVQVDPYLKIKGPGTRRMLTEAWKVIK